MNRQEVFDYVKERYGTEPDYPWADGNAVLRHRSNGKWYGLVMEVRRDRLGLSGGGTAEVLNVKCDPVLGGFLRGQEGFLPAYHMNKEKWLTILLDGTAPEEDIRNLLDASYELTAPKERLR